MQLHDSGLEPEVVLSVRDGIPSQIAENQTVQG